MKRALVIGASSDIGLKISEKLSKSYNLILTYNKNKDKVLDLSLKLKNKCDVKLFKLDLLNEEDIANFLYFLSKFNDIEVVINNAAIYKDCFYFDKKASDFLDILKVNLVSPFVILKYLIREMKKGTIINISSTNGIDTYYPESLDYDASKAALINMGHNLAVVASPNIRVNTICPGWINSNQSKNLDPSFLEKEKAKILLKNFGDPEDVANLVEFLVSDKAKYINDEVIRIDGGIYGY